MPFLSISSSGSKISAACDVLTKCVPFQIIFSHHTTPTSSPYVFSNLGDEFLDLQIEGITINLHAAIDRDPEFVLSYATSFNVEVFIHSIVSHSSDGLVLQCPFGSFPLRMITLEISCENLPPLLVAQLCTLLQWKNNDLKISGSERDVKALIVKLNSGVGHFNFDLFISAVRVLLLQVHRLKTLQFRVDSFVKKFIYFKQVL